jgi:hypothetical protein
MFGIVDERGVIRFAGSRRRCHDWLRHCGLECYGLRGWSKPGWLGGCQWHQGEFHAWISRDPTWPFWNIV